MPEIFENNIKNWWNWKTLFFWVGHFGFFLLHPHKNQSKFLGLQGWVKILMITMVSSPKQQLPKHMKTVYILKSNIYVKTYSGDRSFSSRRPVKVLFIFASFSLSKSCSWAWTEAKQRPKRTQKVTVGIVTVVYQMTTTKFMEWVFILDPKHSEHFPSFG